MRTLSREEFVKRLLAGHHLEEIAAGDVVVMLLNERVPTDVFNEFVQSRYIEERRRGWWALSWHGRRRLTGKP